MPETEVLTAADRAAADMDRFEALLDPQPDPDPTPEPEPEPEPAPAVAKPVAAKPDTADPAKPVDRRTREGRLQSIQQQIDADTQRKHTAKAEADAEEARLATLRAERARLAAPAAPVAPVAAPAAAPTQAEWKRYLTMPDAPKPEQFTGENSWQEYQYAVNLFVADKRFDERMAATQHATQVQHHQQKFTTRIQAEVAKDPTFAEKLNATPVDTRVIPYLHQHPQGDEIMVYLVQNPSVAQRLTTLTPIDQVGEIGGIVATLKTASAAASSGPASKPLPISRAKPLIKPVSAAPDASDDDDEDEADLSPEEFIRRGNAKDPRLLRRRR